MSEVYSGNKRARRYRGRRRGNNLSDGYHHRADDLFNYSSLKNETHSDVNNDLSIASVASKKRKTGSSSTLPLRTFRSRVIPHTYRNKSVVIGQEATSQAVQQSISPFQLAQLVNVEHLLPDKIRRDTQNNNNATGMSDMVRMTRKYKWKTDYVYESGQRVPYQRTDINTTTRNAFAVSKVARMRNDRAAGWTQESKSGNDGVDAVDEDGGAGEPIRVNVDAPVSVTQEENVSLKDQFDLGVDSSLYGGEDVPSNTSIIDSPAEQSTVSKGIITTIGDTVKSKASDIVGKAIESAKDSLKDHAESAKKEAVARIKDKVAEHGRGKVREWMENGNFGNVFGSDKELTEIGTLVMGALGRNSTRGIAEVSEEIGGFLEETTTVAETLGETAGVIGEVVGPVSETATAIAEVLGLGLASEVLVPAAILGGLGYEAYEKGKGIIGKNPGSNDKYPSYTEGHTKVLPEIGTGGAMIKDPWSHDSRKRWPHHPIGQMPLVDPLT